MPLVVRRCLRPPRVLRRLGASDWGAMGTDPEEGVSVVSSDMGTAGTGMVLIGWGVPWRGSVNNGP